MKANLTVTNDEMLSNNEINIEVVEDTKASIEVLCNSTGCP